VRPANATDEVTGREVEAKLRIVGSIRENDLRSRLRHAVSTYQIAIPEAPDFAWEFDFRFYAGDQPGSSLYIASHRSVLAVIARSKFISCGLPESQALLRNELKREFTGPLSQGLEQKILSLHEEETGLAFTYVGSLVRRKWYFLCASTSQRVFSISVDRCLSKGRRLDQVEVEYKWSLAQGVKASIEDEVIDFSAHLAALPGLQLEPTTETKLEWLRAVSGLAKIETATDPRVS
jgi:hypothetical protein